MNYIYLDYNATTPTSQDVKDAMRPYFEGIFGNPSSTHWFGVQARKGVENARAQIAALLRCDKDEIYFTSGGSEANNLAIKGLAFALRHKGRHIITSKIEHPAVLQVCHFLEQLGFTTTALSVDKDGLVDVKNFEKAIRPDTILATIMHANNEVGTIQPINELSTIAQQHGVLFHTDAAQSVGKIPVSVGDLGVDLLSIAGHKFYAPKGIGALYIKRGISLQKQMHGADHEHGMRAGTENVLEIIGLGQACENVRLNLDQKHHHLKKMAQRLLNGLLRNIDNIRLNGHPEKRLPNTLSLSFHALEANTILSELATIAASAGAACHSDQISVSHVLEAMRVPTEWVMGTVRFSVGAMTTTNEIDIAIEQICTAITKLRSPGIKAAGG